MLKKYANTIKTRLTKDEFARLAKKASDRYVSIDDIIEEESVQKGGADE